MRSKTIQGRAGWFLTILVMLAGFAHAQTLNWKQMPGAANDIGVGPKGDAWVIGTDKGGNDYGIYRLDGANWTKIPGGAVRIDVGPAGPWVVNSGGGIYRWNGSAWDHMPGAAKDVGIGANGAVWVIGTNAEAGGFGIYRWVNNNWAKVPGSAVRIDVDPQGNAWVVNNAKNIYRWNGSAWEQMPGAALDIGIGANGAVYVVGTDNGVYQWVNNNWVKRDGVLTDISVDHQGNPWGVNAARNIYASGGGGGAAPPPPPPPPGVATGPALSSPETAAVMKWIADRVGSERQGYCWRDSYGRGVGTIPSDCGSKENDAGLCYDRCRQGYGQAGPVCWGYCPSGFSDHGVGCTKPGPYGRGSGYPWKFGDSLNDSGMLSRCRSANPSTGCEKWGAMAYPKCKAGFHNVGCCICSPDCPSGYSDTGATCLKPSYGRGAGTIPTGCGSKQNDAGLCYPACKQGFAGVGPVCWGNCPSGKVNCGAGCAASSFGCAADTANMVIAPAILVVNIVTAGSASAGTSFASQMAAKYKNVIDAAKVALTAKDIANAGYQVGKTTALWVNDYVGTFAQMTSKQVNDEINRKFSPNAARWVKEQFAMNSLTLMMKADGIETAQNMLNAASGFDPTGVSGVVSAYAKPVCSTDDPFPTVRPRY